MAPTAAVAGGMLQFVLNAKLPAQAGAASRSSGSWKSALLERRTFALRLVLTGAGTKPALSSAQSKSRQNDSKIAILR
jgi:hypothetical protein